MELKKYFKTVKNDFVLALAIGLIIGIVSYFSAPHIQSGFRSQKTFYLASSDTQSAQGYNFGGYFSQSTAINETDTAVAVLESPDFQSLIPGSNAAIATRKLAPQVIQITITSKNADITRQVMERLPNLFNLKMHDLNPNGPNLSLNKISDEVVTSYHSINSKFVSIAGFIFGMILAFLILGLKTYLEI